MTKLTFGYLYDFRNPAQWRRPWAELYADILDFAAHTEALGFDRAWVTEHPGADDGYMPSPLVALAARSAARRVGKACVRTCRDRCAPVQYTTQHTTSHSNN